MSFEQILKQNQRREIDVIVHDFDALEEENETVKTGIHGETGYPDPDDRSGWGITDGGH